MRDLAIFRFFSEQPVSKLAVALLDILIVAFLIYRVLMLVRGTRGWRILLGLFVFAIALVLSEAANLVTLHWVLDKATLLGPVALVILFLPELRQTLESLTKIGFVPERVVEAGHEKTLDRASIEEIVGAVSEMARDRIGAIIVIETGAPMDEIVSNGVLLNAKISTSLLGSVFYGQNPLHDGAVIIRGDHILAAACRLPLSESSRLDRNLHMRHRAAIGVTEQSDCVSIVVSEERGTISVVQDGRISILKTSADLREFLIRQTSKEEPEEVPTKRLRKREKRASRPASVSSSEAKGDSDVESQVEAIRAE